MIVIKILIIRCHASVVNRESYNLQEEGMAKSFVKRGHKCDIIYYNSNNQSREEMVSFEENKYFKIYWLRGRKILTSAIFNKKELDKIISNYDIVQVLDYEQLTSIYVLRKYSNKALLYHGPYLSEYSRRYCKISKLFDLLYGKKVLRNMTAITKSYLAEKFLRSKGIINVSTIGVGLDLSKFNFNNKVNLEPNKSIFTLLYIGQLEERRNIKFIIDLVSSLNSSGIDTIINLIGSGNQEYVKECKSYASDLGVESKVNFLGKVHQTKLHNYYNNCDIFILPTKYEIFGMVLLEAMAFNCIVVTSVNGGAQVIIKNEENGFIVDGFDVLDWVQVLTKIYNSKNSINLIRINAGEAVYKKYNWDTLSKDFISVYNELAKKNLGS